MEIASESGKSETIGKKKETIVFSGAKFGNTEISNASDDVGSSGVGGGEIVDVGRARLKSGLSDGNDDWAKGDHVKHLKNNSMGVGEIEVTCWEVNFDAGELGVDALKSPEREARGADEDGAGKGYEMKPEGGWDRPELDILYEEEQLRESPLRDMLPVVIEGEDEEQPEPAVEEKLPEAKSDPVVVDEEQPGPAVEEKLPEAKSEPVVEEKLTEASPEPAVEEKLREVVVHEPKPDDKLELVVEAGPPEHPESESNDKWVGIGTLVEDEEAAGLEAESQSQARTIPLTSSVCDDFDPNITEHSESVQPHLKTPSQQSINMHPGHTRTLSAKTPHQASPAKIDPLGLTRSEYEPVPANPLPEEPEIVSSESENSTDRQQRQDNLRRQNSIKEKQKLESILLMKKKFDSGKKLSESGLSSKNSHKKKNLTEEADKLIPQAQVGLIASGGADLDKKSDSPAPQIVTEFKLESSEIMEENTAGIVMKNRLFVEDKAADEEARVAKKSAKKEEKQKLLIGDIGDINERLNFSPEKPVDPIDISDGGVDDPKGDEILEIETKIGIIVENDEG